MQVNLSKASDPRFAPLLATLNRAARLQGDEVERIEQLKGRERFYTAESYLHTDEQATSRSLIVTSGWAARLRWLADGRRQIVSTLLPGDLLSGGSADVRPMSRLTVVALTDVHVADISSLLATELRGQPRLAQALVKTQRREDERLLDQIVRLGRQRAVERVAHWIMEIEHRLGQADLSIDGRFCMPLSQRAVGDTLGLSVVHVNRVFQELRRREMITFSRGEMAIISRSGLRQLSDYVTPIAGDC